MADFTLDTSGAARGSECAVMRRKLITYSSLNIVTGAVGGTERSEWKVEPCKNPLWSPAEKAARVCKSCAGGWTHPNNYPVVEIA